MSGDVLTSFEQWMRSVGIEWATDAITLTNAAAGCSGLALGVQAVRDVAEGERLCTIPKSACLSIRTTSLADVIEAEELGGGLGLVLAVLHEMSLGPDSKWHGYFQALPAREFLPLFWADDQLKVLQGTELERRVPSDRQAAKEDFEEHILPLAAKYPGRLRPAFLTLHSFHVAAAYVASRAFGVDEWHGDAMVPLADIFNHKASVVDLAPGYEVHGAADSSSSNGDGSSSSSGEEGEEEGNSEGEEGSEMEVKGSDGEAGSGSDSAEEEAGGKQGPKQGPAAGSRKGAAGAAGAAAGSCHRHHVHDDSCRAGGGQQQQQQQEGGRREGGSSSGDDDEEGGDEGVLPSVMSGAPASIYGLKSANGLHLRLEMGIVDKDEETLEIVAASAVPQGREVHNTYGELGNADLVCKYGFALRQNPFTSVTLDKAHLLSAAQQALGAPRWRQRSRLLREQTELLALEEHEEPFEALPNGHISPALFVALRVLCAPDEEAAGWSAIADALHLPAAAPVAAGAGGTAAAGGDEAGSEGEGEEEQQQQAEPELGAVQVWHVLDADGLPRAAAEAGAAAADAVAANVAPAHVVAAAEPGRLGEPQATQGFAVLLNRRMCLLLQGAGQQRLAAYAAPLQQDLQQLQQQQEEQQQQQQAAAPPAAVNEQQAAERAALMLRITEKEVLQDLLTAVQRRLAVLPAEEEQQQQQQTKEKRQKKQAAAGGKEQRSGQQGGGDASGRKRAKR